MFSFLKRSIKTPITPNVDLYETQAIAITDIGEVRTNNEDNIIYFKPHKESVKKAKGTLAIVCDGMGGHNSGEIASQMAIDAIVKAYYNSKGSIENTLKKALITAHDKIKRFGEKNQEHARMGTTCTAVVIHNATLYVAQAGDSRAYLINNKRLKQLTKDHTYVQHLVDSGVITEAEKENHPNRNMVTMVLGTQNQFVPDTYVFKNAFGPDDTLLLCSDGLYEYVNDQELESIIMSNNLEDAAQVLIDMAKKRGGHDNISVILVAHKQETKHNNIQITKRF